MPNEPSSTDNFVQIDDRVINKVADATDTTDNITLDDRVLIFKENENKQVDKVCNATVSWLVDKFAEEATQAKNDAITAKSDAESIKNSMQSSLDSAIESAVGSVVITADATVNETVGTPSVTVTQSGPNTNRKFSFAFSGLKGEKGDVGEQGPQGPQGETGPQGPQGEKGDSPTIPTATSSVAGIMKLFTALGQNTDGAPTNKAVQDAISAISIKVDTIWENPNPHEDFSPQYIELNSKNKLYLIVFRLRDGAGVSITPIFPPNIALSLTMTGDDSRIYFRLVNAEETNNRFFIGQCQTTFDWSVSNDKMIPLIVYGIR